MLAPLLKHVGLIVEIISYFFLYFKTHVHTVKAKHMDVRSGGEKGEDWMEAKVLKVLVLMRRRLEILIKCRLA